MPSAVRSTHKPSSSTHTLRRYYLQRVDSDLPRAESIATVAGEGTSAGDGALWTPRAAYGWVRLGRQNVEQVALSPGPGANHSYFRVAGCNSVGHCVATGWSAAVAWRIGRPEGGIATIVAGGAAAFLLSSAAEVDVTFGGFSAGGTAESLAFEVGLGTSPFGAQASMLSPVSSSPVAITAPLLCGHTYYATVRATSCGGLSRTVSSEGAKLCCAGPTGGPVEFASVGSAVRFATNVTQLEVRWGALSDSCSGGVESIEVGVEVDGVATWASGPLAGANTSSVALPSGLADTWAHGAVVRAVVNATSLAGVRSSLASTLTVDLTPPVKGQVELYMPHPLVAFGQLATGDACISLEQGRVTLRWTSVVDLESGITSCVLTPLLKLPKPHPIPACTRIAASFSCVSVNLL